MHKTLLFTVAALALNASLAMAQPADFDSLDYEKRKEAIHAMSPDERHAFFEKRREKWQSMSDEEKLKKIEEHRAERKKMQAKREAEWQGMSDKEKIAHVEEMMKKKHHKMDKGPHGKPGHDGPPRGGSNDE